MKISYDKKSKKLWLSQEAYVERVIKRFKMSKTKSVYSLLAGHLKLNYEHCPPSRKEKQEIKRVSYALAVGSLMYAMVYTRSNIVHAVGVVSQFLSNPDKEHWTTVKWILRYLRGTSKAFLYIGSDKFMLQAYTDAYIEGDVDSKKISIRMFAHLCKRSSFMAVQNSAVCCLVHH